MKLSGLILFLLLIPIVISAQELEHVKSTLFASGTYDVCVDSQYVYGAGHAFFILSPDETNHLNLVDGIILPNYAIGFDVSSNFAYTATDRGLQIVDFSDPHNYILAGTAELNHARMVKVQDNYAYLSANGPGILKIISVSDPYHPVECGTYQHLGSQPADMVVDGDYLYYADSLYGLYVLNISDCSNPVFAVNTRTILSAASLEKRDSLIYIISNHLERTGETRSAFQIFNVASPFNPICIGVDSLENEYFSVISINGNYAYINTWQTHPSLLIYDISDPTSLELVSDFDLGSLSWGLISKGSSLYTSLPIAMEGCIKRYDISNPVLPVFLSEYFAPRIINDIRFRDSTLFVCDDVALHSINISNPDSPIIRQYYFDGWNHRSIVIRDSLMYGIVPYIGFTIYNTQNPDSIYYLATMRISGGNSVYCSGNYAYLTKYGGFCIIDLSIPNEPDSVGFCIVNDALFEITGNEQYLYISSQYPNRLNIFDIINPLSPQFISSMEVFGEIEDIAILGNLAYTVSSDSILSIIDISNPLIPLLVLSNRTPAGAYDIELLDNLAFVACHSAGVIVYDVSNPDNIDLLTSYDTPDYSVNLTVDYPYIYVADGGSLVILRFNPTGIFDNAPNPLASRLSPNYPNPFNSSTSIEYAIPAGEQSTLNIYDICGRSVRAIPVKGSGSIVWNGRDDSDKPVSSGVYFYKIAGQPETARKMLLMK